MCFHGENHCRAVCQLDGCSWQEASETAGVPALCGQVLSPRGRYFEQVVAWMGKVSDSLCCPFLPASGIRFVNERLLTAYDLLGSADDTLQCWGQRWPAD